MKITSQILLLTSLGLLSVAHAQQMSSQPNKDMGQDAIETGPMPMPPTSTSSSGGGKNEESSGAIQQENPNINQKRISKKGPEAGATDKSKKLHKDKKDKHTPSEDSMSY